MKNFEKILLVTVFFCILPVANLFALSKEATEAIEAMRARLRLLESNQEQTTENISSSNNIDEYVPGRELSAVLARIRRERFEAEKRSKYSHIKQTPIEEKTEAPIEVKPHAEITEENIIVANDQEVSDNQPISESAPSEEKQEVIAVPAVTSEEPAEEEYIAPAKPETTNQNSQDEIIIIEAMEADDSEAWAVPINNKPKEPTQEENNVAAKKAEKSNEYVTGQLLERSIRRIRHSQRRSTPASSELDSALEDYEKRLARKQAKNSSEVIKSANEEIEELFNNSEKYDESAVSHQAEDSDNNQIDDEKFNDYISKYDFKMPENYRIIVE